MNTLHLKYAVEVAKTGSITLAAENLYMNQPNLSKAIKELETSIGIDIFKRTPKGILPTKKGEEFLGYAKNILNQIDKMEALYKLDSRNKISFSLSSPRASYISYAFSLFVEKLDNSMELEINFKETNSIRTIKNVAEGEYRLGIIRYQKNYESYFLNYLKDKGLQFEELWEFECLALMSENNPLALCDNIYYKDLKKCIEIVHGDITIPYLSSAEREKNEDKEHKRRRIYIYERGSQFDLLKQVTESYMWVSPLPKQKLEQYGLIQRKCAEASPIYKDIIIYLKNYNLLKIDKAFIAEINSVKDSICSV